MFIHWTQVLAETKDTRELELTIVFAVQCETEPSLIWQREARPTFSALAWAETENDAESLAKARRQEQVEALLNRKNKEPEVDVRDEADGERRLKCYIDLRKSPKSAPNPRILQNAADRD
jgi:hypothetical protein